MSRPLAALGAGLLLAALWLSYRGDPGAAPGPPARPVAEPAAEQEILASPPEASVAEPDTPAAQPQLRTGQPPSSPSADHAALEGARLREQGMRLLRDKRVDEARAAFEGAIALDPSAENHAAYGRALRDLFAMTGALYHLRAAAEAEPDNADRWIELANAYYRKPDPGEAWKAEKRAREAEPGLILRRENGKLVRAGDSGAHRP